jgi:E3 ubiquitin-protein ligase UBR4
MAAVYDNRALLQSLSRYIVREETQIPEDVALSILKCLLPMGAKALNPSATAVEGLGFGDLIAVMKTLAGAGSGVGHVQLFRECAVWLESCKNYIVQKNVIEKLEEGVGSGKHVSMVENACHLLNYVSQTAVIAF